MYYYDDDIVGGMGEGEHQAGGGWHENGLDGGTWQSDYDGPEDEGWEPLFLYRRTLLRSEVEASLAGAAAAPAISPAPAAPAEGEAPPLTSPAVPVGDVPTTLE